ncbi:aldo/keto reductase [Shimia sp. SDUM112013]|uniref:aldo/keto reductase n=1 Tax=Shimia sp. SDUM112013 TaxID=3136160 RepID=UPI0032F01693
MKMNPLGRTGIQVSELCLGTMTFGTQTDEPTAHAQIEMALAGGINFVDAAEMYPVNPISAETTGLTETIIGNWFAKTGRRNEVVLATKHSGAGFKNARDGAPISSKTIPEAIEGSLRRLQTDHIDLYQFHWPNRGSYMFRQNWHFDPSKQSYADTMAHMEDSLEALQKQVEKGNIRAFGLSNESAWGTSQWLRIAEEKGWPRVASIQNEYSLLCRLYDTDLAELSVNEDVGLLAFSPLGAGFLTGKYQHGSVPGGSRMSIVENMGGRKSERVFDAVDAYLAIAQRHEVDPVHMALVFTLQRPFMCASIFGATTLEQLEHILTTPEVTLSEDCLKDIDDAHRLHPMPY